MERLIQPPFTAATDNTEVKRLTIGSVIAIDRYNEIEPLMCFNISPETQENIVNSDTRYIFRVKKLYTDKKWKKRKEWIDSLPNNRTASALIKWVYPTLELTTLSFDLTPFDQQPKFK